MTVMKSECATAEPQALTLGTARVFLPERHRRWRSLLASAIGAAYTFCWLDRQDGCAVCSSCWIGP
jgi:hypothetical protein